MTPLNPDHITYFAKTDARGREQPFGIKARDRTQHVYVIGKTGMGKSTLLENMAIQDMKNGEGFAFIDPHGKTADLLLDYVPEERLDDVVYFAPFDMEHPVAFNVMEDVGYDKRHLVVNGLMAAFKKIWVDSWSARMEYILQNTILALLEYPEATMLDVNRMYTDKKFREMVVGRPGKANEPAVDGYVKDPLVKSFWIDEYASFTDRYTQEATPAIQNKVGQFTGNPLIRNIIGQSKSTFDLREIMDKRKILIVNLSKGQVGEGNANLLGSMMITKIYLAALSRADVPQSVLGGLPNFYLYVDEFQSFANESFADILSEARKYKLNLTMAHQYIEQMPEEVRAAVFGNVGTMIAFRVGAFDAEVLEKEFAPQFTAQDIVNLGFSQIYLRLMIDGVSSSPFSARTLAPIAAPDVSVRKEVIERSRKHFARPRAEVEKMITEKYSEQQKEKERQAQDASRRAREENERNGTGVSPKRDFEARSERPRQGERSYDREPRRPQDSRREIGPTRTTAQEGSPVAWRRDTPTPAERPPRYPAPSLVPARDERKEEEQEDQSRSHQPFGGALKQLLTDVMAREDGVTAQTSTREPLRRDEEHHNPTSLGESLSAILTRNRQHGSVRADSNERAPAPSGVHRSAGQHGPSTLSTPSAQRRSEQASVSHTKSLLRPRTDRSATPERMSELSAVLSSIRKEQQSRTVSERDQDISTASSLSSRRAEVRNDGAQPKKEAQDGKEEKREDVHVPSQKKSSDNDTSVRPAAREVPEEVLRKILEVKE